MAGITFDSGPLIAFDRRERKAEAYVKLAQQRNLTMTTSAAAVAEVWRDGSRNAQLARALRFIQVVSLDQALAREAGELLGATESNNTIDAIITVTAASRGSDVVTGDPEDFEPLCSAAGVRVISYRDLR